MSTTNNSPRTPKSPLRGVGGLFHNFGEKLQTAITRFPLTFACIVGVAVLFVSAIHTNTDNIYTKWIMGGIVSAFASLSFYLFAENRLGKLVANAVNIPLIGLIIWLFSYFSKNITDANAAQFVMLTVSFFLALFFAGYLTEKNSLHWWDNLQKTLFHLIISAFFAGILMGGLSLALVSLDKLFGLKIDDKMFAYLAVFCFVLFMPSYFLSQLSEKTASDESFSISYPAIFKILGLYILLPILAIYTLILYGYLFKIIASWELPNGWVSWLVSIVGLAGFLTIVLIHPIAPPPPKGGISASLNKTDAVSKSVSKSPFGGLGGFFLRFFPLILLPLLVLMFVGIVRRFSDYGITINRLLVLILNIWFFGISIYLFISHSRQPKWILISFAIVAFLSAVGPWSVVNVTEKSLKKEFSALLTEAGWTNSKENQIKTLDKEKQTRLYDVAYYLQRTYGIESIRPMFSELSETAGVENLMIKLGISDPQIAKNEHISVNSGEKSYQFDISNYNHAIHLRNTYNSDVLFKSDSINIYLENYVVKCIWNNKVTLIPLESTIEKSVSMTGKSTNPEEIIIKKDDYKLIIFNLDGQRKADGEVKINHFNGLLLMK